jgi:histidinol dehydrogenase
MRRLVWSELSAVARAEALARPRRRRDAEVADVVRRIFDDVERDGAAAVTRWSLAFDRHAPVELPLSAGVVDRARAALEPGDLAALDIAVDNVRRFHEATKPVDVEIEIGPGARCRRVWRPIVSCGLYAPGGSAPLFSTLVMLAEPARVAGVPARIVVTPPGAAEAPHPMMIAAAAACGMEAIWLIGGAQAIAALALGAVTPRAEKIFGPGNAYVAEAKRYAASLPGGPLIDVPAGPSELMVIADERADAAVVAADLLSQAEHDADAQVLLVSASAAAIDAIDREVRVQTSNLPRAAIAEASLTQARAILVRDDDEAADVANAYAPEHLSLQVSAPGRLVERIVNAGAVFLGRWSAETFGDYICGPSHVLPTDGAARVWSGVGVASFMKSFVVQELDEATAHAWSGAAARLARLEGLEAHARAAEARVR